MKFALFAATAGLALVAPAAHAAVTINITQVGGNVVAQTSGSLNTTGLVFAQQGTISSSGMIRGSAFFFTGTIGTVVNAYNGLTGPQFGSTLMSGTGLSSGDGFGFHLGNGRVFLPTNYVSGAALSAMTTYEFKTLSNLGLTLGSYVYAIGSDSITLNIGQAVAPVPEASTWAMMVLGFGVLGAGMRRRSTKVSFA